jgi:O-acetyl-ADP-ribose deacetylase (regulator of RNase III)
MTPHTPDPQLTHVRMDFTQGNILQTDTEAIVNTVNCVGFMGRGLAAQFKRAYPANFEAYAAACARGEVVPGKMFVFTTGQLTNPRFIVNFPTKRHWRGVSSLEDIESGLRALVAEVKARRITSIAIPPPRLRPRRTRLERRPPAHRAGVRRGP